jgi:hypothetical protein
LTTVRGFRIVWSPSPPVDDEDRLHPRIPDAVHRTERAFRPASSGGMILRRTDALMRG